jgi:hypothetical protein
VSAARTECVFELERPTTAAEVNELTAAAKGPLAGILGFEARPLVSIDYQRDTRSSIVDGPSTLVTDGTLLKVYAWYDNEMGYDVRRGQRRGIGGGASASFGDREERRSAIDGGSRKRCFGRNERRHEGPTRLNRKDERAARGRGPLLVDLTTAYLATVSGQPAALKNAYC